MGSPVWGVATRLPGSHDSKFPLCSPHSASSPLPTSRMARAYYSGGALRYKSSRTLSLTLTHTRTPYQRSRESSISPAPRRAASSRPHTTFRPVRQHYKWHHDSITTRHSVRQNLLLCKIISPPAKLHLDQLIHSCETWQDCWCCPKGKLSFDPLTPCPCALKKDLGDKAWRTSDGKTPHTTL